MGNPDVVGRRAADSRPYSPPRGSLEVAGEWPGQGSGPYGVRSSEDRRFRERPASAEARKEKQDRSSTSQQPLSEVSSRGEKLLQGTRSGARRQEPPSLHPNQAGTTPAHGETWPHGQVLAQAFFSFGPCTARFLFGKTKKKMGGALPGHHHGNNPPAPERRQRRYYLVL